MIKITKAKKIILVLLPLIIILSIVLLPFVEETIKQHTYHVWIYNTTNEVFDIIINDVILKTENKTFTMDKIYRNKTDEYNYTIKNENGTVMEKTIYFFSNECGSFSAGGGIFSMILIEADNDQNYNVIFTTKDADIEHVNNLRPVTRKRLLDMFNFDGLN